MVTSDSEHTSPGGDQVSPPPPVQAPPLYHPQGSRPSPPGFPQYFMSHSHAHSHAPGPGHRFESLPESSHFHDGVLRVEEPSRAPPPPRARLKQKRASGDLYDKRKTTCMLYLQADHLFYEKMGRSEEACIEVGDYNSLEIFID